MNTKPVSLLLVSFIIFFSTVCITNKNIMAMSEIDYSKKENWVSLPDIHHQADVFYVYPTIYTQKSPPNMDINDPELRENAVGLLNAQAGVYAPHANLFAPFYRQQTAATQSMEANNGGKNAFEDQDFRLGYADVEQAFDYYIQNLNQGRPFILAGHSQGSMVIIELLRNRLNSTELQERFIAAYAIGYSLTREDLEKYPWMKLASGETDTGVIITYNTQAPDAGPSPVLLEGAVAINPLNWRTDATPADRKMNKKAVFFNDAKGTVIAKVPNFCSAAVDEKSGALLVMDLQYVDAEEVDLINLGRWSQGVYHRFDYAFFYENLKENVKKRIEAFLSE